MSWTRSLLKYPGGKYTLLDVIDKVLPRGNLDLYAEPFLGGGSVALNIGRRYPRMLLNDANADIITFWEQIAKNPEAVLDEVHKLVGRLSTFKSKDVYLQTRATFNERSSSDLVHAAMFYFLNKQGFNGLVRYNAKGEFNVPHGNYKKFPSINYEHIQEVSSILTGNVTLHSMDWSRFIKRHVFPKVSEGQKTLVYFDPPYIPLSNTSNFTGYWKVFGIEQHKRLRKVIDELTEHDVKCVLSNSKTKETEEIFKSYNFIEVEAPRNISCKGDGRGAITEYLITNFK
jgi:DNA adenine methylase